MSNMILGASPKQHLKKYFYVFDISLLDDEDNLMEKLLGDIECSQIDSHKSYWDALTEIFKNRELDINKCNFEVNNFSLLNPH